MRETTINYGCNDLQYVECTYIQTDRVKMDTRKPRKKKDEKAVGLKHNRSIRIENNLLLMDVRTIFTTQKS